MALAFKKGDGVRQVVVPISGTIVERRINNDEVEYLVEWKAGEDGLCHRWFKESEIELMTT